MHSYTIIGLLVFLGTFSLTVVGIWRLSIKNRSSSGKNITTVKEQHEKRQFVSFSFDTRYKHHVLKFQSFLDEIEQMDQFNPEADRIEFSISREGHYRGKQLDMEDFIDK